jgi:hypothetical protein
MRQVRHADDKCFVDEGGKKPRLFEAAAGDVTEVELSSASSAP